MSLMSLTLNDGLLWLSPTPRPGKAKQNRGGFTLIELVTVLGILTMVMTSVAVAISSLHRLNVKLRVDLPASAAVTSLGLHLRTDVHAAREASVVLGEKKESVLRLSLTDQKNVEYSATQSRATRVARVGDRIERREVFELPRGCELIWAVDGEPTPLVTLVIQRHTGKLPGAMDDVQATTIVTAVGLDHITR